MTTVDRRTLLNCVHCGLCLTACPTFRVGGNEADSPRGRLYLMRAVSEGRATFTREVTAHFDSCVGCRACESVCPAGVPYGRLLEATRDEMRARRSPSILAHLAGSLVFRGVLPHPRVLRALAVLTRAYQRSGMQALVRALGLLRWAPAHLRLLDELLPRPAPPVCSKGTGTLTDGATHVAFLRTCMMDVALPNVDRATRLVLERNRCAVTDVRSHGCCGALHAHAGRRAEAQALARRTIAAAEATGSEVYVTNSAGCGAAMKDYAHLLAGDPAWSERATHFAARVRDVSEYLAERGTETPRPHARRLARERVAYQDACHLAHGQGVRSAPRSVLASAPHVDLVDLPHSDWCCGSGGIYNVLQPRWADALLRDKTAAIRRTGADVLAVANPGCALHIGRGLRKAGLPTRVAHPVEILAQAYVDESARVD